MVGPSTSHPLHAGYVPPDRPYPTSKLWVYDFRSGQHFALRQNKLQAQHLDEFVAAYNPDDRHDREESERFKCFTYDELLARDKVKSGHHLAP